MIKSLVIHWMLANSFRLLGVAIGLGLMALAVYWRHEPDPGSLILFLGGVGVIVGSVKRVANHD